MGIIRRREVMKGVHPLLIAAKRNDVTTAKELLDAGANINVKSYRGGVTPLMTAAALGNLKMVKLLLRHNPDLTLTHHEPGRCGRPAMDCTALDYAVFHGHTGVAELLRERAAKQVP